MSGMKAAPQLLICDDDSIFHLTLKLSLKDRFNCKSAYHGDEAIAVIKNHPIDILLLDIHMRGATEGFDFIPKFRAINPNLTIIMVSSTASFHSAREAMRQGVADYMTKDFEAEDLMDTLNHALKQQYLLQKRLSQEFNADASDREHSFIGNSKPIQKLRKLIDKAKKGSANVIITGETGTGKEVLARQLRHTLPNKSLAPFIAIDSATIQHSTAESTLFGHEKGAFTGADQTKKGIFEEAHLGTVYFDEIANMPLSIQAKLLRVLQEKEVTRLGSAKTIKLEFRVICATNKNLEKLVELGDFKDDLLQRLNVIAIEAPPLRERTEDIPLLITHFTQKEGKPLQFTSDAMALLENYSWPGNVRELSNLVIHLITMSEGDRIHSWDLPMKFRNESKRDLKLLFSEKNLENEESKKGDFYETLEQFEKELLKREYNRHRGNITQLSIALRMDRSHLYSKLKALGIHRSRPRSLQPKQPESEKPAQVKHERESN